MGLLSTSKPPSFHSPDGEMNTDVKRIFPCVEAHCSLMKASATCMSGQYSHTDESKSRTEMRCKPHISHSSFSFAPLPALSLRAAFKGRTRSVMMNIVLSDSTASMYLSTSGCLVTRNFRRAFFARGSRFLRCEKSYSNTETGEPSSWKFSARALALVRATTHSFRRVV